MTQQIAAHAGIAEGLIVPPLFHTYLLSEPWQLK